MSTAYGVSSNKKRRGKPMWHYSNWMWVLMFVVILGGAFYPLLGLAVMICFAGAVISGPIAGRWWCGNLCPRGNFWDRIMSKAINKPKMPAWAKNKAVRVTVLVLLMGAMTTQLVFAWDGGWPAVGRVFVVLLTVTTAIGVFMALTGHQRAWCKVCPAGTMAYWLSKGKRPQLEIDEPNCKHCDACHKVCPMDLGPSDMAGQSCPTDADCLKCNACVERCPVDVLELTSKPNTEVSDTEEAA